MEYEIWSEGYITTGEHDGAVYHGKSTGVDFRDACVHFAQTHPIFEKYFDEKELTFWACRLFDNEADARESFG